MIKTGLIWTAAGLLVMLAAAFWAMPQLPADGIPTHWGFNGEPDRFSSREEATAILFLMPAVTVLLAAMLAVAPMLDPFQAGLRHSAKAYLAGWVGAVVLMTFCAVGLALMMVGGQAGPSGDTFPRIVLSGAALMIIVLGNYLPKTRQSFFLGVRTPWTLTSAIAWERTHRLAGLLFVLAGLFGLFAALFLDGLWAILPFSLVMMAVALICIVYSYFAWRSAPDKIDGADYIV